MTECRFVVKSNWKVVTSVGMYEKVLACRQKCQNAGNSVGRFEVSECRKSVDIFEKKRRWSVEKRCGM